MGWWITLTCLVLIAILPLGVNLQYDSDGPLVMLILGPVRLTLFPASKTKEKRPKKKPAEKEKPKQQKLPRGVKQVKNEKKGGSITDFFPLVRTALEFLGAFRRKLRVNFLELKIVMAGGDPCNLAVNYGKAWAAVGNLQPQLERIFVIKKRKIDVECDFTGSKTTVYAHLDFTITLGRLIALAVHYGVRVLKEFIQIKNKRKGGAVK